jgi:hypothetical protein
MEWKRGKNNKKIFYKIKPSNKVLLNGLVFWDIEIKDSYAFNFFCKIFIVLT